MTIHKLATFRVRAGDVEKVRAAVASFVDEVGRKEGGTAKYEAFQHADDPARFTHYMVFRTPAAEKYHGSTPWVKKFQETVYPLCEEPPTFSVVAPVAIEK